MRITKSAVIAVALAGLLGLAGCGKFFVSGTSLVSIAISPKNASVLPTKTQQFTATGTYGDGSTKDITSSVTWSSSTAATATINTSGLATAVAVGTTTITASSPSNPANTSSSTVTATTTLTVANVVVTALAIAPTNSTLRAGQTQQYTATATFSDGTTKDVTTSATWNSSSAAVASINSGGLATALTAGSTSISATSNGFTATTTLTVTAF